MRTDSDPVYALRICCALAAAWIVGLALYHAANVPFYVADGPMCLQHFSRGWGEIWLTPSPYRNYRPVFGTWYALLSALGASSPAALRIAALTVTLAGSVVLLRVAGHVLPESAPLVAATIFFIHPLRQEHLFWPTTQIDGLALLFSLLCIDRALRSELSRRPLWRDCAWIAVLSAGGVWCKEIALLLPVVIALCPSRTSYVDRWRLAGASLLGVAVAAAASLAVLGGSGRSGVLVRRAGSVLSLAYPIRLVWPWDIDFWTLSRKGATDPVFLTVLSTAGVAALGLLAWLSWTHRRSPWLRVGAVLFFAGWLPWIVSPDDRSMGLGVAGFGILLAGVLHRVMSVRGGFAAVILAAALAWSPLWLRWEHRWREAAEQGRKIVAALGEWRREAGDERMLVAVGTPAGVGPGAHVVHTYEIDRCSLQIFSFVAPNPASLPQIRLQGTSGRITIDGGGGAELGWPCKPRPSIGVMEVSCDPATHAQTVTLDPVVLERAVPDLGCGPFDVRRWDGLRFSALEGQAAEMEGRYR